MASLYVCCETAQLTEGCSDITSLKFMKRKKMAPGGQGILFNTDQTEGLFRKMYMKKAF